jgi:hypothetical protein
VRAIIDGTSVGESALGHAGAGQQSGQAVLVGAVHAGRGAGAEAAEDAVACRAADVIAETGGTAGGKAHLLLDARGAARRGAQAATSTCLQGAVKGRVELDKGAQVLSVVTRTLHSPHGAL